MQLVLLKKSVHFIWYWFIDTRKKTIFGAWLLLAFSLSRNKAAVDLEGDFVQPLHGVLDNPSKSNQLYFVSISGHEGLSD